MTTEHGADGIPDIIRAKAFHLVDDDGYVRASLATDEDGQPFISLDGEDYQPRFEVSLDSGSGSPVLSLYGQKRRSQVVRLHR